MTKYARLFTIPALIAGLGASPVLSASPASAAASCPSRHICGYDETGYGGRELFDVNPYYGQRIEYLNDRLESVINRSDCDLMLYDWSGYQMAVYENTSKRSLGEHNNYSDNATAGGYRHGDCQ